MASSAVRTLPLQGIRVVDSSYVFALPYTGGLLADMGAEVIKIEGPARSDITRTGGLYGTFPENEPSGQWWDRSSTYNLINRGKKSLTLDLTTDRGKELFRELVAVSDVVLENYTPRVMRGFGLDYAELRKVRPDIIMASNTGYGHGNGPYSGYPAQATTQEGTHGLCWVTGYVDGPPSKAGASFVDFISTWSAMFAIGAALRHRNLTGEGQWIDMSMYQGAPPASPSTSWTTRSTGAWVSASATATLTALPKGSTLPRATPMETIIGWPSPWQTMPNGPLCAS